MDMELKSLRKSYNLSQFEASKLVDVPIRTYRRYEQDNLYGDSLKREKIIEILNQKAEITEEKGILTIETIQDSIIPILRKHQIRYCYLFGSYAKGCARENSDVDLLIDTELTGFDFFNLIEEIRVQLHKKIDLLRLKDLQPSNPIILDILKDGIKIL